MTNLKDSKLSWSLEIDQEVIAICAIILSGVIASLRQQRNNIMGSEMLSPLIPRALQSHKYHYVPH